MASIDFLEKHLIETNLMKQILIPPDFKGNAISTTTLGLKNETIHC